jgi:hypothetical protein
MNTNLTTQETKNKPISAKEVYAEITEAVRELTNYEIENLNLTRKENKK